MADVCKESNNEKYKICLLGIEVRRSVSENEQKIEFSNGRCLLYYKSANFRFCPHSVFMCFVWIWEQTAIISLYSINWLVCVTETECVYCAVRIEHLTFTNSTFCPHSVFMCFVWIWEQTAIISLYSINWLVCITETECVYYAVRTESLHISQVNRILADTVPLCISYH